MHVDKSIHCVEGITTFYFLILDHLNRFLKVTFDSTSGTISCRFQGECNCICHIEYGICNNHSMTKLTLVNSLGTTGQIKPEATHYCYSASATMASKGLMVVVHGSFYSGNIQKQNDNQTMKCSSNIHLTIIYAIGSTVVVSLISVLFVATVSCIYVRSRLKTTNTESISPIYDDLQVIKETSIYADKNVAYSTS